MLFVVLVDRGFAQIPVLDVFFNDRKLDCNRTINDTCPYYVTIGVHYDSIHLSTTFPKLYFQSTDSIRIMIYESVSNNKCSTTLCRKTNGYTMSKYIPGIRITCSPLQYNVSMIFFADKELLEDKIKLTNWEDDHAYTGGLWERCGLPTNIFNPYRISQPNSQIVYSLYEAAGGCDTTLQRNKLSGMIQQFFDSKGRCVKEIMGDVSILYKYSIWGILKKEFWFKQDSLLFASVRYVNFVNYKKAFYRIHDVSFSVITHKSNQTSEERCYNEVGAKLWDRTTLKDSGPLEKIVVINNNEALLYKKNYDSQGNILTEGFVGNNSCISYEYTRFDGFGMWTQVIQYIAFDDMKIPVRIIEKNTIENKR